MGRSAFPQVRCHMDMGPHAGTPPLYHGTLTQPRPGTRGVYMQPRSTDRGPPSPPSPARGSLARPCSRSPSVGGSARPPLPASLQWTDCPGTTLGTSHTFWILLCSGDAYISNSGNYLSQCQALLNKISSVNPQAEIDGLKNIWIVKPAAKSRGRGES